MQPLELADRDHAPDLGACRPQCSWLPAARDNRHIVEFAHNTLDGQRMQHVARGEVDGIDAAARRDLPLGQLPSSARPEKVLLPRGFDRPMTAAPPMKSRPRR